MSGTSEGPTSVALQILFGVAGIFSVAIALFGLHYRDSLGFVLYRQLRSRPTELYELEAGIQYSDSTTAGQRLTTSTASVQDLPSDNIPSATPSISGSTAPTILITDTGYCNTKIETNPAQS